MTVNTYKILVCTVRNCILVTVKILMRASSDPNHRKSDHTWFHVPRCVLVSHLFHALVELYTKVLTSRWKSIEITDCFYAHTMWHLDSFGGIDEHWVIFVGSCDKVGHLAACKKPRLPGLVWCRMQRCYRSRSPWGWNQFIRSPLPARRAS